MRSADRFAALPAPSASDALRLCRYNQPDLLLLDLALPDASGLDVLREIRAAGSETPVLIVSAHQDAEKAGAPTELHASGFLGKPIDFDDLLGRIATLTASS